MTQLIQTINKVRKRINPNLKIDGVLITLADMQTKVGKTTLQTLQNTYGSKIRIYDTIIPQGIKAVEGTFLIFMPQDAHMPCISIDTQRYVKKAVVKVKLS